MKRLCYLMLIAFTLFACEEQNTPSPGGNGGNSGGGGTTPPAQDYTPVAKFVYTVQQPLMVKFEDKSECEKVTYDFGDGHIETYTKLYPVFTHTYSAKGTYTVIARAFNKKNEYTEAQASIEIPEPKVYVVGIQYLAVGKDGKYYKAKLNDDDFFTTTWFTTNYTPALTSDILPYTYAFKSPVILDGLYEDDYYDLYIYWSDKASGNGTQILKQTLYTTEIYKYKEYYELKSNNADTKVRILMEYR